MMAKVRVVVCDVCEDIGKATKGYRITSEGKAASVDLCVEHAEPLEVLLTGQGKADKRSAPRQHRTRRSSTPLKTLEEIEREKAERAAK